MATGVALVDRRRGPTTGRPGGAAGDHRAGGRRGSGVQHRAGSAHGRRRAERGVRGGDSGPWRRRPRHHRIVGRRVGRRRLRDRGSDGRDVRARPRTRSPSRPWPVGRALPAELRPRDCRRVGGIPRGGSVFDALRQDRIDGGRARVRPRRRHGRRHRGRAGRCRRARPHPTRARVRRHARRDHEGLAPHPSASRSRRTRRVCVPDVPRRDRRVPSDAPSRCHTGRAPVVRRRGVRPRSRGRRYDVHAGGARRRRPAAGRRDDGDRRGIV